MVFTLTPSAAPPRREYVLLISGTMNPPHCGHIRLGLHAAQALAAAGHTVASICFVPVHDNYLLNKLALTAQQKAAAGSAPAPPSLCWPLAQRCEMLRALLREEDAPEAAVCEVLDYELTHGGALLEPSPGYWGPRLPGGYLRTVPSAALIRHFAAHAPQLAAAAAGGGGRRRLGVVFGVDNLGGMASWERPAQMLAQADVVLVARAAARVTFGADPSDLLGAIRHLAILAAVPVFAPKRGDDDDAPPPLFGAEVGPFANSGAGGDSALFLLPPLVGADEHLSSTKLRDALANGAAGGDATLAAHGYASAAALGALLGANGGAGALAELEGAARARGEWEAGSAG